MDENISNERKVIFIQFIAIQQIKELLLWLLAIIRRNALLIIF